MLLRMHFGEGIMRFPLLLVSILIAGQAGAQQCHMSHGFTRPDDDGASTVRVWVDPGRSVLFGGSLHVNTDGAKRSYRVDDFWGSKSAVNNLCNAMSDKCAGLTSEPALRARRIATEQAKARGWNAADFAATKIDPSIIPLGPDGKPCPEQDGFLVSATGLVNPAVRDACNPARYADSMTVPAIVVPRRLKDGRPTEFEQNGAHVGDLVVVATRDLSKVVYAVVGDTGPRRELGEGTIALAGALLGKNREPANYKEVRGKAPYRPSDGWDVSNVLTLILSGTRNRDRPYMSKDRIDSDGAAEFAKWGGIDRLRACAATYRP